MCRHLAYLGPAVPRCAAAAASTRRTGCTGSPGRRGGRRHGTVNADGFGVGWYADGDPEPGPLPAGRADLGGPVVRRRWPG